MLAWLRNVLLGLGFSGVTSTLVVFLKAFLREVVKEAVSVCCFGESLGDERFGEELLSA